MIQMVRKHLMVFNLLLTVKDPPALDAKQLAIGLLLNTLEGAYEGQPAIGTYFDQVTLQCYEASELETILFRAEFFLLAFILQLDCHFKRRILLTQVLNYLLELKDFLLQLLIILILLCLVIVIIINFDRLVSIFGWNRLSLCLGIEYLNY